MAKELRTNEQIGVPRVRVVRDDDQLGIMETREAQRIADEATLDLVEVAPAADPPVVRIMDYGKFKYEQAKKERESRKSSKHSALREVRMRVKIDEHDIAFKARTARKLLAEGDKVKISVMFRAREITHPEVGRDLLDRFYERISDVANVERSPAMEGRMLSMVVMGDPRAFAAQAAALLGETEPATESEPEAAVSSVAGSSVAGSSGAEPEVASTPEPEPASAAAGDA